MGQTPEELAQKIRDARDKQGQGKPPSAAPTPSGNAGAGQALRAATDLVAALVVGGALGYGIDQWLGTTPWGMIVFFFLGFGAGFVNIYRSQTGQDYKVGFKGPKDNRTDQNDDA